MSKFKNLFLLFTLLYFTGLSFNAYAGTVTLPNYIGGTEQDAIDDMNATDGLTYNGSTRENNAAPVNQVIDQDPAAGEVDFDTSVTLVVSDGPSTTTSTTATPITTTATPVTTTADPVTTTGVPVTTTADPVTTTAAPITTTGVPVTTTLPPITTTLPPVTTTTTLGGAPTTTTTAVVITTTSAATTTTSAVVTTTTTLPPPVESVPDVPLDGSNETVTISTEGGESISNVSTEAAIDTPDGYDFPAGIISYTTTSKVGGTVTMTFKFSTDLPDPLAIFKVDSNNNYTELPKKLWKQTGARTVEVDVTDGDPVTDQDGQENGSIEDPVAVAGQLGGGGGGGGDDGDLFDFGGGGCTISNTQSAVMDPIWLLLLLAPGLGLLRRRAVATGRAGGSNR